ncbi:c-type cytochrome [Neolewinella antarctica]|uniref:Mono/diheme cytochrome c family protein n=1 Tax=Neolewinella antarctica TaxID=442734 RepID=A0ABX0X7Z6_9BACT|nr:cytochrome c [Neolewinella antarctica]NJC25175.1 mono/diheme cytochrome c family protein [Neolewinella antarctica]
MKDLRILVLSLSLAIILASCSDADENFAGSEYMPDMAHSLAQEANTYNYYYYNTWDDRSTIKLAKLVYPRVTVKGAVPRGYAGRYLAGAPNPEPAEGADDELHSYTFAEQSENGISTPTNGFVPYYYEDSPEGRERALAELNDNPFPITEAGMVRGANLYNIFCGICHGAQGNGLGYIYDEDQNPNAAYPLAPANFLTDEFKAANNGRFYHAIQYGYNAMGAYKDKISYEERWQVIHYIRSLQAKDAGAEYDQDVNTLNPTYGTPMAQAGGVRMTDDAEAMGADQLSSEETEAESNQLRKK